MHLVDETGRGVDKGVIYIFSCTAVIFSRSPVFTIACSDSTNMGRADPLSSSMSPPLATLAGVNYTTNKI